MTLGAGSALEFCSEKYNCRLRTGGTGSASLPLSIC